MDRGQGPIRLLVAGALLLCAAADRPQLPIREARWLKSPDVTRDLTTLPPECIAWPIDKAQRRSVAVGRALFRSPLLLGGQAARAGLSCASCHRNGRGNPHFHFPGISGEPGTADVTASLMSEHRGDGRFNPKPIPDLAGNPATFKVSRDPATTDLDKFIHGLVSEEFDGPEPSPAALKALAAYVRALNSSACPADGGRPLRLAAMLGEVGTAVDLARRAYAEGDSATGRALLAAARSTLGAIDERFQTAGLDAARTELRAADAQIHSLRQTQRAGAWNEWERRWPKRKQMLRAVERRSLFNPAVLRQAL